MEIGICMTEFMIKIFKKIGFEKFLIKGIQIVDKKQYWGD